MDDGVSKKLLLSGFFEDDYEGGANNVRASGNDVGNKPPHYG